MLTPIDIHNKEFKRSFRGYNEDEIDDFLDQVVNDYEMLYRENRQLKDRLALSEKELDQYHQLGGERHLSAGGGCPSGDDH